MHTSQRPEVHLEFLTLLLQHRRAMRWQGPEKHLRADLKGEMFLRPPKDL